MHTTIELKNATVAIDLSKPLDISLPVTHEGGVGAWYIDQPQISHVEVDGYVGKVSRGGSTNFNNVFFNPHSHGTHTECIGHITEEFHSVNAALQKHFFYAQLITVQPEARGGDLVITPQMFDQLEPGIEAMVIRTMPNKESKKQKNYSHKNPPYLDAGAGVRFRESGITNVLIDLPSVDKEKDGGALAAHKAIFDFNGTRDTQATITELIYVPSSIKDGLYMLDLQVAPLVNDAAPSRPVLYEILK